MLVPVYGGTGYRGIGFIGVLTSHKRHRIFSQCILLDHLNHLFSRALHLLHTGTHADHGKVK